MIPWGVANQARPILPSLTSDEVAALQARLDDLFDRSGGPEACWPYTPPGAGSFANGYPVIYTTTSAKTRRLVKLHRLIFELETGESPPSVDHLCHDSNECKLTDTCPHRRCGNPAHLGASTIGKNAARAKKGVYRHEDLCGAGLHRRTEDNIYESPGGDLRCRPCEAERAAARRSESRAMRQPRQPKRHYRPRGMDQKQLVEWALDGRAGTACFSWPEAEPDSQGYIRVRDANGRMRPSHVLVYEVSYGSIPPGHVVDHLCHDPELCEGGLTCPHRACINPAHLGAVTRGANSAATRSRRRRPTQCKHGHDFTPENTYTDKRGSRHCLTCRRETMLARYRAAREGVADARFRTDGECRNGHLIAEVGLTKNGLCRECRRASTRRYRKKVRASP